MKARTLIIGLILFAPLAGCANQELRVAGAALEKTWAEIRPLAERGLSDAIDDGDIQPASAPVIRRTFDEHGALIDEMRGSPDER